MANDEPQMSLEEFRRNGYLQEVNRQFLHRLGLALSFIVDEDTGQVEDVNVLDHRNQEDGMAFAQVDPAKAMKVQDELRIKDRRRYEKFGWSVQPVGSRMGEDE